MNNLVEVNNVALGIKEYNRQRVVTFKDIDKVHERPDGTARNAFNRNKKRFVVSEDYFVHETYEARKLFGISAPNGVTTITESGYLMISKVFDDDISWEVQRKLVSSYFRLKEESGDNTTLLVMQSITETLKLMQQDISLLKTKQEEQSQQIKQIPKKKFSSWTNRMFPKYQLLMDYFDISRKELYHNLYIELQNMYPDIDLRQDQDDYCFENGLDSCFTMDVIEHNRNLRNIFTCLVDSILEKYKLNQEENMVMRTKTIFDI